MFASSADQSVSVAVFIPAPRRLGDISLITPPLSTNTLVVVETVGIAPIFTIPPTSRVYNGLVTPIPKYPALLKRINSDHWSVPHVNAAYHIRGSLINVFTPVLLISIPLRDVDQLVDIQNIAGPSLLTPIN